MHHREVAMKTSVRFHHISLAGAVLLFACVILFQQQANAQPTLNFKRIVNNWPTIELYFSVGCNGQPAYTFNKNQHFKVFENGIEVPDFTLYCPDPNQRCAMSVALVFDASGSMMGAGNAGAIAAGNAFVDTMDGLDEAAVIWFSDTVTVAQAMTSDKLALRNAINSLPVTGSTACWDGMYTGLQELIAHGNNPCRAVITVTDGGDNASFHTPQDVIALANQNQIRMFNVGLGGVNPTNLELISLLTGGTYYSAQSADQLVDIYKEIAALVFTRYGECTITYQAQCKDGGLRSVDLALQNFCSGADTKTKTYRAPKDTASFTPLALGIGSITARSMEEVRIPVSLVTPIDPLANFEKSTFSIQFDPGLIQFKQIEARPGTLLEGLTITALDATNGTVTFETNVRKPVFGSGTLAELVFQLADPDDTTCCTIMLNSWVFQAGCFRPVLQDGEICIIPRSPVITCNMQAPAELVWVRSAKDYSPNPFQVMCRVYNMGEKEAKNVRFKIDYNPADIQLLSPFSDLQPGTPVDVPATGLSEVAWMVKALTRTAGDSVDICFTAMFDNHKNVTCCQRIWIPATGPVLHCSIQAPQIIADNQNQKYTPMPFDLTVSVTNPGGMKTDTVWATIIVPPKLTLAGADAPNNNTKKVSPRLLIPNQSGSVTWTLAHPISVTELEYVVQVWEKTSNADSTLCETKVTIPPLMAPMLQATCMTPYQLTFDDNLGEYTPNPFNVQLQVINASPALANNVTAFMWMPANVELIPATQSRTHSFGTLTQYNPGNPVPTAIWTLRYTKKLRLDSKLDFKWSVGGVGPTGIPTDSANVYCTIDVPGLKPSYECTAVAPDSLGLNGAGTKVEPNPFTFTYTIRNTSKQVGSIQYIEVYYSPGDGIDLDVSSPNPKRATINKTLEPGKDTSISWIFKATNRITRRTVQLQAVAIDDEGNPITCTTQFPIAAVKTALTCELTTTENVIRFDRDKQQYINPNWVLNATLENVGGSALSNISAELLFVSDPSQFVEFDPSYSGVDVNPSTSPVLFVGSTFNSSWHLRLTKPNTTGISQYVEFTIRHSSSETPIVTDACNVILEIQPALPPLPPVKRREVPLADSTYSGVIDRPTRGTAPKMTEPGRGSAPAMFSLSQNKPNPFNPSTTIEYTLAADTRAVVSVYNILGKQVRTLVNEDQKAGTYRVVFNADGLPSGLYFYKLETPQYSNMKRMVLAK